MKANPVIFRIKELAENILSCEDNYLIMRQSVNELYSIFSEITGVTCDNFTQEDVMLPSGKAISPSVAAYCLLEMKRSTVFLRGINKAIQNTKTAKDDCPVKILYAGTGPYATLILPLLPLYSPNDITVDIIDINEISLNAVSTIIKALDLKEFIGKTYLQDAATFKIEKKYDIVISETMQAALKKEPQVAIMQNLIPQMPENAIFIPEKITISAGLVSKGHWDAEKACRTGVEVFFKDEIISLGKEKHTTSDFTKDIVLPGRVGKCNKLELYTTITVYDDEILKDSDCSLTFPVKVCELDENQSGKIHFWYESGDLPGFKCSIEGKEGIFEATGRGKN